MNVMIVAAAFLPIPAYKGGATEGIVTDVLNHPLFKNNKDLKVTVVSHCEGKDFTDGNVGYYFIKRTILDRVKLQVRRIKRLLLFKRINIIDDFSHTINNRFNLNDFDVIVLEGNKNQVLPLRKIYKGKIVLHIHTVMTFTKNSPQAKKIYDACDLIIGNSEFSTNEIIKINPYLPQKVKNLNNCIRIENFRYKDSNLKRLNYNFKRNHNLSHDSFVIIYCGRIEPGKGVLELIEAIKNAKSNIYLIVVGASWFSSDKETPYLAKVKEASKSIKDRVCFTGYVPHDRIGEYYASADASVMPSIYNEAAGLVALEAQACGIPVIISNIGGIPEFVHKDSQLKIDVDSSFVKNLSLKIDCLAGDESLYLLEKNLAMENVAKFNMDSYSEKFLAILKSVINEVSV